MPNRRQFINVLLKIVTAASLGLATAGGRIRIALAEFKRRILGKDTVLNELVNENPAHLDAGQLPVTPREKFETMGLSDHEVVLADWRLAVTGAVRTPLNLKYEEILKMPTVTRSVLLICPGFFAYKGLWKGVSIGYLVEKAQSSLTDVTHVVVSGPAGSYEKSERFQISQLENDKLFLAYAVNDIELPQKHGYPLRLVAEDHYGSQWVKYVEKIELQNIEKNRKGFTRTRQPKQGEST